ncbi:MAG TPA: AmmeMemoRadiSam system protein B [Anaerolineae bacterium]|nr:AmmeMemoRadiSam system protein B [Anaerolineae bacterium]
MPTARAGSHAIRPPAVAGTFYPADPIELTRMIDGYLAQATTSEIEPSILIAPHAGYVYSGPVAAFTFKALAGRACDGVIVLGFNHAQSYEFDGASIWLDGAWRTPLGDAPIDSALARSIRSAEDSFYTGRDAHATEHSIEVMLPFLQRVLPGQSFVPVSIGRPTLDNCRALADGLARAIEGKTIFVVASTDLSHYPPYEGAVMVDRETVAAVLSLDPLALEAIVEDVHRRDVPNLYTRMCGQGPVLTAMMLARRIGAERAELLRYSNSGDVPEGGRDRVVGYAAIEFSKGAPPALTDADRAELLRIARATLVANAENQPWPELRADSPALRQPRATFVTLRRKPSGELRGCRGEVFARSEVWESVRRVTVLSAVDDPRFVPLQAHEIPDTHIEISVLSPLRQAASPEEVVVGRHGVLVRRGGHGGLFLPQVPVEQGWDRETYLDVLCEMKAGLPRDAWRKPDTHLYIFEAEVFEEHE